MRALALALLLATGCAAEPPSEGPAAPRPAAVPADDDDPEALPEVGIAGTPLLPGSRYRVHDGARPQPRAVKLGDRIALPPPGAAPSDAVILFDGSGLERFTTGGGEARWKLVGDAMEVNGTGDIETRDSFGDIQLHLEFRTPAAVAGDSQGRGNSGVFLMGRYEVQVLDSWRNPTYPDGQTAALYGQRPPLVNAAAPPGEWQSYDIVFLAPRFAADGALASPARITLFHNGILAHHDVAFLGGTRHREVATYELHPPEGPIRLQDHGNPVQFRNIWVRALAPADE